MVFAIHWHESAMDSHVFPIPIPPPASGSSQCTSLEHLSHASNLGWWSVSPLIVYLFHAVLSEHPTLAFSHRVQKSVLYICVSFSVLHIGLSLPCFKIPYICISILYWSYNSHFKLNISKVEFPSFLSLFSHSLDIILDFPFFHTPHQIN